jgi:hypothetical protein
LESYLIITTLHNKLEFIDEFGEINLLLSREIEMGSVIITSTGTTVTFQLPRGNLETISPRPLILDSIHKSIDRY